MRTLLKTTLHLLSAALWLLLLASCQGGGSANAEQAARQLLLRAPSPGAVIDPTTIEILQTVSYEDSTIVLLSYQRVWEDRDEKCLSMYKTRYQLLKGWTSSGGVGACSERQPGGESPAEALHLSGGTSFAQNKNESDLSHVLGRVNDSRIERVRILWKDGQSQEVPVVKNTFLALRNGNVEMKSAAGLDASNAVVYTVGR